MFNNFLCLRKGNSVKSISLLFLFLLSFSLISSYTFTSQPISTLSVEKSGYEANANVTLQPIPEKIDTTWWQEILILLNIKEADYKTVYVISICYDKPSYAIDKTSIAVPTTITKEQLITTAKTNLTRELVKANTLSVKPDEYEVGDNYCYYDKLDPSKDLPVKYGENSIYIYTISSSLTYQNNTIWESNNVTHLEINNSADNSPYNSLIGYWSFDADSNTTSYDLTGYNKDGTYYNGGFINSTCDLGYGSCIQFDGIDDGIDMGNINGFGGLSKMSFSVWFKTNSSALNRAILAGKYNAGGSAVILRMHYNAGSAGKLSYDIGTNSGYSPDIPSLNTVSDNKWYHAVGVYNGTLLSLYLNGVLQNSAAHTGTITSNSYHFCIGASCDLNGIVNNYGFDGSIDEVMIFNSALNSSQILDIYNNQSSRFKSEGSQSYPQTKINMGTNNTINITIPTTNRQNLFGSTLGARVGYWNISYGYDETWDESSVTNLIQYWRADGSANDTRNIYNGTFVNQANATGEGRYGTGFGFDGAGDYLNTTYKMPSLGGNSSSGFAISLWLKIPYQQDWKNVWGAYNVTKSANYLQTMNLGRLAWNIGDDTAGGVCYLNTNNISDNQWHHIVAIKNYSATSSAYALFSDGVVVDTEWYQANCDGTISSDFMYMIIGGVNSNGAVTSNLVHYLDEVMIFNQSLNASQVKDIYMRGRANWQLGSYSNISGNQITIPLTNDITNVYPELKLFSGTNNFYTPFIIGNISMEEDETPPPTITWVSPTTSAGSQEDTTILANVTSTGTTTTIILYNPTDVYETVEDTNATFSGLAAGYYNLTACTSNIIGTTCEENRSIIIVADAINPTINFTNPTDTTGTTREETPRRIVTNVTGDDTNWANVTINIYNSTGSLALTNTSTSKTFYWVANPTSDGLYYFNATATDTYNNRNSTETRNITFYADNTPPVLTVTSPLNQTYSSTSILIHADCTDANTPLTYYSLDGGTYTNYNVQVTLATSGYEVYHTLAVKCNDSYGNTVIENRRFYVGYTEHDPIWNSTLPQSCPLNYFQNGTYTNGSISCALVSIPSAVTSCKYTKLGYYNLNVPWLRQENCV